MVKLVLDGRLASTANVGANDGMGFGRFDAPNLEIHTYELFVAADELTAALSDDYRALVEEMRADDRLVKQESAFSREDYPSTLASAFCYPLELEEVVRDFLYGDILQAFVPFSETTELVINSAEEIRVTAAGVTLVGRCFRRRR